MLSKRELKLINELGIYAATKLSSLTVSEGESLVSIEDRVRAMFSNIVFGTAEVGFPGICCISPKHTICHGIPDDRRVSRNDLIKVDLVIKRDSLYVDTCWTFLTGKSYRNFWMRCYLCFGSIINFLIRNHQRHLTWLDLAIYGTRKSQQLGLRIVREFAGHGIDFQMHTDLEVAFDINDASSEPIGYNRPFTIEPIFHEKGHSYSIRCIKKHEYQDSRKGVFVMFEHTIVRTKEGFRVVTLNELDRRYNLIIDG